MTDQTEDLPVLYDDDAWLDLHTGDRAIIRGQLDHLRQTFILISFADWSQMTVEVEGEGELPDAPEGETISLIVTKTEDGLVATLDDVRAAVEKMNA